MNDPTPTPAPAPASVPGLIFDTHLEYFDHDVIEASHALPVLVDFWADWCPPCRALTPVLERVIAHHAGKIHMAKVEVDEGANMKLAGRYALRGFPTVLLFVGGEIIGRFSSAHSEHWVREFVTEHTGIE
ncbi:thioredoxin family protein [Thiobacillus sp.]